MGLLLRGSRPLAVLGAAILVATTSAALARADADPASDMLLTQSVFYPYTSMVSSQLQKALNAETAAASRAHLPIRVALIPGQLDLGGLPTLYEKPQQYAAFLDQELSNPPLLVVMPDGFGLAGLKPSVASAGASLVRPAGKSGDDLARAAIAAIPKLTDAAGHPIPAVSAPAGGGSSSGSATPAIAIVAVVAIAASAAIIVFRRRRPRVR